MAVIYENRVTKEDKPLHQDMVSSSIETKDIQMAENDDEEEKEEVLKWDGLKSMDKTLEEDYASSEGDFEQGGSDSEEDEEDEEDDPGELLMSIQCDDGFCESSNVDSKYVGGQPLAPEGAENFQLKSIELGDDGGYEDVSCSESSPQPGIKSIMMTKEDRTEDADEEREEEQQNDLFDSQIEGMKIKQEEDRDLIAAVDWEENVETIKDFSGEEHQEGGEGFTEYFLDCSSCEYIKDEEINQEINHQFIVQQLTCLEKSVAGMTELGKVDSDEEGDNHLYSRALEEYLEKFRSQDVISAEKGKIELVKHMCNKPTTWCDDAGEPGESDSSSSGDDEARVKRSGEVLSEKMCWGSLRFGMWDTSDGYTEAGQTDFNIKPNLDLLTSDNPSSQDLFTTEDTDKWETPLSAVTHRPAENVNTNSEMQRGNTGPTSPSDQGCLDDSFFFNTELEASGTSELGLLRDDDFEDKKNWEEGQERIRAFYRFNDQSNREIRREGE